MRRLGRLLITLLALLLLLEEWLWDHLKRAVQRLTAGPAMRALEDRLRALPPWASLLVLLSPALLLTPFKLAALWAFAHGHAGLGVLVFVAAKLTGTALAAYLFDLVRESARRLAWFDRFYRWVMDGLARAHAWVQAQPAYQHARIQVQRLRARMRARLRPLLRGDGRRLRRLRRALRRRSEPD